MPVPRGFRTRLFPARGASSSLGRLAIAGTIRNGGGVPAHPMRVLGAYAAVYLLAGQGEFSDAQGTRRRVEAGDLMWVFPEIPHAYGPAPGGKWDEIYVVFDGPVFDLWRERGLLDPADPVWRLGPVPFWHERIAAAIAPSPEPGADAALLQAVRLQELFAEMRVARDGEGGGDWLARACRLLEREAAPDLRAVARGAAMSYETFRKRFARQTGLAPAAYRQARRIERACVLLMRPGATNKEVAERLGFCDEFHFAKAFSRRMGFSPRAFRRKALGA